MKTTRKISGIITRTAEVTPARLTSESTPKEVLAEFLKLAGEALVELSQQEAYFPVHVTLLPRHMAITVQFVNMGDPNLFCPTSSPLSCHIHYDHSEEVYNGFRNDRAKHIVVATLKGALCDYVCDDAPFNIAHVYFQFEPGNESGVTVTGLS